MSLEYASTCVVCWSIEMMLDVLYRWLAIRLEFVGNLVIFFTALFAAIQINNQNQLKIPISPGLVGVAITCALQVRKAF